MGFADIGGVPAIMASTGSNDNGYLPAMLSMLALHDRDDDDHMLLFIVFVIILFVIIALIWSKNNGNQNIGYGYGYGVGAVAAGIDSNLDHREHWDIVRDTKTAEKESIKTMLEGNFALARQADYNHYTTNVEILRGKADTDSKIADVKFEQERQTLLLMREMDRKEAESLRERLLRVEMEKSNLHQSNHIINTVIQAINPRPVPVNAIYGQVPIPAAVNSFHPPCGGGLGLI